MNNFEIYYNNIRGVKSKINSLRSIIKERRPEMIVLVETWLEDKEEFMIEGYTPYRNNRNANGGGVVIAVKNNLKHITKKVYETKGNLESIWITIDNNKIKTRIGAVYIPKEKIKKAELEKVYNQLSGEIEQGMISCHQTLVIGDTNAKIEDEGDSIGGKLQEEMIERLDLELINGTEICEGR